MTRTATARSSKASRPNLRQNAQSALTNYMKRTERPLQSLVFIFPLILIYEIGWRMGGSHLLAFNLLHQFLSVFGATGTLLPALMLVSILLAWHIACREKWTVDVQYLLGMALESWILALPLIALAAGMARWQHHGILAVTDGFLINRLIIAMGAGIYEEMLFRLILLTLLHVLLVDIFRLSKVRAGVLMVVISGVSFSLYHYLGSEPFAWPTFLFRTVAGAYFSGIFLCRGFGVTAGCHATYDVIVTAMLSVG